MLSERDINGHIEALKELADTALRDEGAPNEVRLAAKGALILLGGFLVDVNRIANAAEYRKLR